MLPRYFVPRADPVAVPPLRGPLLTHVRDVLRVGGRGRSVREVVVATDRQNALHWIDDPAALTAAQRSQLHHHELLRRRPARHVDAEQIWLFGLQLLEQPGDAPGLDDPVWLYGRLFGPFPSADPVCADGQLTIARSDLLAGFARGAADALHVAASPPARALHALLPGDREEEIEAGRGLVLAYPLAPAELACPDAGNEPMVAQLLHDVLSATLHDAKKHGIAHPLTARLHLPVPCRADVEAELEAKGWDVRGDVAFRRTEATRQGTLGGFLSQVFGVPDHLRLDLPPEGTLDDFLRLAQEALPGFPGHPDRRARAVAARLGAAGGAGPREPKVPRPSSAPTQPPASAARQPPPARAAPPARPATAAKTRPAGPDWMKDFVEAHGDPHPRLTPVRPPGPARGAPSVPDWMKDFED